MNMASLLCSSNRHKSRPDILISNMMQKCIQKLLHLSKENFLGHGSDRILNRGRLKYDEKKLRTLSKIITGIVGWFFSRYIGINFIQSQGHLREKSSDTYSSNSKLIAE